MIKLEEMLAKKSSLTVDVHELLEGGVIGVTRILEARIKISDEQLHIEGLPSLKLQDLKVEVPYLEFLSIKSPELPNIDMLMIF